MKRKILSSALTALLLLSLIPYASAAGESASGNMAITSAQTPVSAAVCELKWTSRIGTDWSNAPSPMVVADGYVYLMSGATLYKLDAGTGETAASCQMVSSCSYSSVAPTYYEGVIYTQLDGGIIQAFDAQTLTSLWIYTDALGGQSFSPIICAGGYIYTGFWVGDKDEANFVCLAAADEDTAMTDEAKAAVWTYAHTGGFYWAGAAVVNGAVIVSSDDAMAYDEAIGEGGLYSFDAETGEVLGSIAISGDGHSSVAYDGENSIYLTSTGGYFYSAQVGEDGSFSDVKSLALNGQSTSTPVVYDGYAYIGLSDTTAVMIDTASMSIISSVSLPAYPQCSLLLSTAHEDEGELYLYSTYNAEPGGVIAVTVDTESNEMTAESIYDAKGYEQYCICNVVSSDDGTLYYKNDSGCVFALENTDITTQEQTISSSTTFLVLSLICATVAVGSFLLIKINRKTK